jgi:hypothetical protein
MWYRRRGFYGRRPRFMVFPIMILIAIAVSSHSIAPFVVGIIIIAMITIIAKAIASTSPNNGNMNMPPMGQMPYQQPQQPYYQPPQQPYQPYDQGYQAAQTPYPSPEPSYQYQPKPEYDEQPQVQYPQELPPIKQQ